MSIERFDGVGGHWNADGSPTSESTNREHIAPLEGEVAERSTPDVPTPEKLRLWIEAAVNTGRIERIHANRAHEFADAWNAEHIELLDWRQNGEDLTLWGDLTTFKARIEALTDGIALLNTFVDDRNLMDEYEAWAPKHLADLAALAGKE